MALPKLEVKIGADTAQAEAGFKKVSDGIGGVAGASSKATLAVKAFVAGLASISSIGVVFSKSVNEAQKFETTMFRIQAIIKATGGTAGRTADELRQFARNLAMNTLESTEGVLAAQQRLLTFRKVSGDVFDRTIAVAADLSAVLGQDMSGAAIQLGRALEDPVTGLSALARSGTVFTDSQKEMVKGLVESGRLLDAQNFILSELEAQYGGAAVAAAQGYAGALDTLGQRLQELFLSINDSLGLTDALSKLYIVTADSVKFLTDNMSRLVSYVGTAMAASVAYAAFLARGWVASFVAARFATLSLATSLTTLKAALIRTGIGAIIVLAGELIYQFGRLVKATGSFGTAFGLVFDVAKEAFTNIGKVGQGLYHVLWGVAQGISAYFLEAFAVIGDKWDQLTAAMAETWNSIAESGFGQTLGLGTLEGSSAGENMRGQAETLRNSAVENFGVGGGLLNTALPSLEKIRELLSGIKDDKITLPDLMGVDGDGEIVGGGGGKTPIEEQTENQIAALQALKEQGRDTWSSLATFLQQFAGKSKAAAVAVIAINKGLAIAQAIQNTAVAYTKALTIDPTGVLAARTALLGKVQVGIIAATGLAEAMSAGGGSGGSGGGGGGSSSVSAAAAQAAPSNYYFDIQGDTFSRASVESTLAAALQSEVDRGARLIFSGA